MSKKISKSTMWKIILLLSLFIFPILISGSGYLLSMFALMFIYIIAAMGLNLVVGYGGQISVGNAAFLSIGAYSVAILSSTYDINFWFALPLAGIITATIGFLIGLPAVRLSGHFLAVVTLAFGLSMPLVLMNWDTVTHGYNGMGVTRPSLFASDIQFFYVIIVIVIIVTWIMSNILKSRLGRSFISIRDSEIAALAMGVNVPLYKVLMFVLSAFFTGIGGGLYAYWIGFVSPEDFTLTTSLFLLAMIVVGGLASVPGAIIGAVIFSIITHYAADFMGMINVFIGLAVILVILIRPRGLVSLKDFFKKKTE